MITSVFGKNGSADFVELNQKKKRSANIQHFTNLKLIFSASESVGIT